MSVSMPTPRSQPSDAGGHSRAPRSCRVMAGMGVGVRSTIRVLRSAPALSVSEAAAAAGSTQKAVLAMLRRRSGCRSRCTRLSVAAALPARVSDRRGRAEFRSRVVAHRVAPPNVARAVGCEEFVTVRAAARGTAGWAGRPAGHVGAPRRAAVRGWQTEHRWDALETVTANDACPAAILQRLSEEPPGADSYRQERVRCAVVSSRNCPRDVLERLSKEPNSSVPEAVAANTACPPEILGRLSAGGGARVRAAVAANTACSPEVLKRLGSDPILGVVGAVARNPTTAAPVLRRLARHSNARVRAAVASNPRCSRGVLEHLSEDSHDSVRRAVSSHDRCPSEVLDRLGDDPNKWVRSNVADRSR